jgi:TolB-like protein/Flp pilus assembly protein TadD
LVYQFENYSLDVDRQELRRGTDLVPIEPQVFDLLHYLIRNRGRVVSKDDLIANVWNGRIVSESTLTSRITSARQAIGDSGEQQRLIRTIPRKGIRFVGDVQENVLSTDASTRKPVPLLERDTTLSLSPAVAAPQLPDKPSIAVLPFTNMSGDPEQEYFSDGITEDIITALSRLRWFFVIARNSTFLYKGQAADVKHIGRDLGVRYVLEGSVRKSGNRVRITAQLIDAATGNQIWADRHDGELTDVFALQDEITKKVVAAIEPRLLEAEGIRSQSRSPEDLGAWNLVMRANSLFWRLTKAEGDGAIAMLKQAVERYPDYAPAHSMLAFAMLVSRLLGWTPIAPQVKEAAALAARAAELDDSDPWAHLALGYVAHAMRCTDDAKQEYQRAIDLNPNFAAAHGYLGYALALAGRTDEAIVPLEQAIRMSPHDPQNAIFNMGLAVAHYFAGRYTEAITFGRKAVQQRDGITAGHRIYIASLAQAGQIAEARAALQRLKELQPNISIAWCEQYVPYTTGPMAKFLEGLQKAGLQ